MVSILNCSSAIISSFSRRMSSRSFLVSASSASVEAKENVMGKKKKKRKGNVRERKKKYDKFYFQ